MKAILKYGQFSAMIQLPKVLPTVAILKPMDDLVSFVPYEAIDPSIDPPKRLQFRIRDRLADDIYLYEFESEL